MTPAPEFTIDHASADQLERHLGQCDAGFVPPLSTRVDLGAYARKLVQRATRFEAWHDGTLVGIVAAYFDGTGRGVAHISNVSVLPGWGSRGVARALLLRCIGHGRRAAMLKITLEVAADNEAACRLYRRAGFHALEPAASTLAMTLDLTPEPHDESAA
ncbi:MAG: GNAT family N-acetyltransferase [Rubrivivax sp.]